MIAGESFHHRLVYLRRDSSVILFAAIHRTYGCPASGTFDRRQGLASAPDHSGMASCHRPTPSGRFCKRNLGAPHRSPAPLDKERCRLSAAWIPEMTQQLPKQHINIVPGGGGVQAMKEDYGRSLQILLAVCGLVLLIACERTWRTSCLLAAWHGATKPRFGLRLELRGRASSPNRWQRVSCWPSEAALQALPLRSVRAGF